MFYASVFHLCPLHPPLILQISDKLILWPTISLRGAECYQRWSYLAHILRAAVWINILLYSIPCSTKCLWIRQNDWQYSTCGEEICTLLLNGGEESSGQLLPRFMQGKSTWVEPPQCKRYRLSALRLTSHCLSFRWQTPGPGTYGTTAPDIYKPKAAGYSLTGRNVPPGDSTRKPGPGAHAPERVSISPPSIPLCAFDYGAGLYEFFPPFQHLNSTKKKMPQFSFGIRHSEYEAPLIIDPVTWFHS